MSARHLRAYLDESQSHHKEDPDTYLLAATVCGPDELEAAREQITGLRLRGQRKLHWHDESHRRRRKIAQAIAELPLEHLVVVRNGLPGERVERRRRLCLERMLYELDTAEVGTATFESRGPADDKRDRQMVDTLRTSRTISGSLRIHHQKGPLEAMLWVPDAVCGAITSHRIGEGHYLEIIERRIQLQLHTISA